ncbi:MAG: glycosyltransferase [Balneolales bacterium]
MKVIHFKTTYLNLSETFINRLVRNHKSFEPIIATAFKKQYLDGLNIYEMPKSGISGLLNRMQLMFNKSPAFLDSLIQKEKPSVIHGHFALDSYRLISAASRNKIPLIVNFYGYDVIRLPKEFGWQSRYKRLIEKADHCIAGSQDMKDNLMALGFPESRIEIIKLGMDMDSIRFEHRAKAGLNLMMVGRMVEKKGFEYAIKAISILKEQNYQVHLDLFGDGPLQTSLRELSLKLNVEKEITFRGTTGNEDIVKELYNHDSLLVPSVQAADGDREGIPQTIVEGMASGIPIIGSTHAGIPELIEDRVTGLLVRERDADNLARSVVSLYENPELVSLISKNGREKVVRNHCIHELVNKTELLYDKVIQKYYGNKKVMHKI